jgi:hypothetical protein
MLDTTVPQALFEPVVHVRHRIRCFRKIVLNLYGLSSQVSWSQSLLEHTVHTEHIVHTKVVYNYFSYLFIKVI